MPPTDSQDLWLHRDSLLRFVNRRVREPWTSEDILQEAFTRLLAARAAAPILDTGAWLRRVALNLVHDHFRARGARPQEVLSDLVEDGGRPPDETVIFQERVALFAEALARLPDLRREVFVRRKLHGESSRVVAAALDISEAAVDQHVARALLALNDQFGRDPGRGSRQP